MNITDIKPNKDNPRTITPEKLEKLRKSIKDFSKMMELRPIIVDENNEILGGNMRYKALIELGYSEIPDTWIKQAGELTAKEKKRFIIEDNVGFGDWDWEVLELQWDADELAQWGLDLPKSFSEEETDNEQELKSAFSIEIECENEIEQEETYEKLTEMGYKCKVLTL